MSPHDVVMAFVVVLLSMAMYLFAVVCVHHHFRVKQERRLLAHSRAEVWSRRRSALWPVTVPYVILMHLWDRLMSQVEEGAEKQAEREHNRREVFGE